MEAVTETRRTPLNRNYLNISRYKPIKGVRGYAASVQNWRRCDPQKFFSLFFGEPNYANI